MDVKIFLSEKETIEVIAYQQRGQRTELIPIMLGVVENNIKIYIDNNKIKLNLDNKGHLTKEGVT